MPLSSTELLNREKPNNLQGKVCQTVFLSIKILANFCEQLGFTICAGDEVKPGNTRLLTYREALTSCSQRGIFKPNATDMKSNKWSLFVEGRAESQML